MTLPERPEDMPQHIQRMRPYICLALAAVYLGAARGAIVFTQTDGFAHIWPAAGIGLAAMHLCGLRIWPAILLADMASAVMAGQPLDTAFVWSGGNTAALGVSSLLLRRFVPGCAFQKSARGMVLFIAFGPLVASLLSASTGWLGAEFTSRPIPSGFPHLIWAWFLSDFSGIVVLTPLVLGWLSERPSVPPRLVSVEGLALCASLAFMSWLIFGVGAGSDVLEYPLSFGLFPFLAWATFRLDTRSLTLVHLLLAGYALMPTMEGYGPFAIIEHPHSIHLLQLFVSGIASTSLIIHAILHERAQAETALRASRDELQQLNDRLEERVAERTAELTTALADLRTAGEIYRNIFTHAVDGIFQTDAEGRVTHANASLAHILGYDDANDLLREVNTLPHAIMLASEDDAPRFHALISAKGAAETFEFLARKADGGHAWLSMSVRAALDSAGRVTGMNGIVRDITDQKRSQQALARRATHDELTGIANRSLFHEAFARMLTLAQRNGTGLGLLYIDMDNFKHVNDTYGHNAGDAVLVEAVARMRSRLRKSDLMARIGGDEFAILLPDTTTREQAEAVAHDILATLDRPFDLDCGRIDIHASIGASLYPQDADTAQGLLEQADAAMYRAKRNARNASGPTSGSRKE
ncbi:diguanylate cyclase (GGDEF)-like protein/PAS domain S-box-containing protein [Desulfobaculum xiamenense]|uniref:Diguanylate cyclase (GGDEF)-like protein/PAS domain S-box-containing protein n=1 Tax=Desulfobaculum xiamenense TaxID=995050 RepID=A0A846QSJ3_9BACT|nr:diguanylate cyclase [Desulfobaculum xiamenense]NJB67629.1 diguanylate cyclase (GGDEF)-like protein/PAS domain S-box-containing protein [Desulfobaculum xiamenense]